VSCQCALLLLLAALSCVEIRYLYYVVNPLPGSAMLGAFFFRSLNFVYVLTSAQLLLYDQVTVECYHHRVSAQAISIRFGEDKNI
jgi:hypothetical protein